MDWLKTVVHIRWLGLPPIIRFSGTPIRVRPEAKNLLLGNQFMMFRPWHLNADAYEIMRH
jgi:hypothetical protein